MAVTMYNPAHPGEILREYLGGIQVGEAAAHSPVDLVAIAERARVVYRRHGPALS